MRTLTVIVVCALAAPSLAQQYQACGVDGIPLQVLGGLPFMGFTPPAPSAAQSVAITAGMVDYEPFSATATVQGNTITMTLTASYLGFVTPPALSCSTGSVGPLPPGVYVVNLFVVDLSVSNP